MIKRFFCIGLLAAIAGTAAYAQTILTGEDGQGPKLALTGELTGMATASFADESQKVIDQDNIEKGGHTPIGVYNDTTGKNGYYIGLNFGILFSPVSSVDLYTKFLIRYRPGSSYLPLQLPDGGKEDFVVKLDAVYGRVNAVKGLGFDIPLDIWLKAGKYDTQPANYLSVSRYGAEMVMGNLRTGTDYALQLEASHPLPFAEALSLAVTTNPKLNNAIDQLYDEDADDILHGQPLMGGNSVMSLHTALRMKDITLPFGALSWEMLWVLNGEKIYSKNSFGMDLGMNIPVSESLSVLAGLGAAMHGMGGDTPGGNIDTLSGGAVGRDNGISLYAPTADDTGLKNDADVTSFREALRIGVAAGVRYDGRDSGAPVLQDMAAEFNLGFAFSNLAHYYRDTLTVMSLSADLRVAFQNRYFIGGGVFLGTLADAEWKTKQEVLDANTAGGTILDNYGHIFTLKENMGFEVYCGLKFDRSKFVLGFNNNKGLSMSHGIEAIHETQIVYRQKDSGKMDGLFETGGFFAKLVLSW